jgi:hypothetical protein
MTLALLITAITNKTPCQAACALPRKPGLPIAEIIESQCIVGVMVNWVL